MDFDDIVCALSEAHTNVERIEAECRAVRNRIEWWIAQFEASDEKKRGTESK